MTLQTNILNGLSKAIAQSTNAQLREHYNSPFWQTVRKQANDKLANATRKDGTLVWSKLPKIFTTSPKLEKQPKTGVEYLANAIYGAPSFASLKNTCATATLGCGLGCLTTSGHGQLHMVNNGVHHVHVARVIRTLIWFRHRDQFKAKAQREIDSLRVKAFKLGVPLALRPNGTTDLQFETLWPELFTDNPDVQFWDYTKSLKRNVDHIANYSLCYSVSETTTGTDEQKAFDNGLNCVVVLRLKKGQPKPKTWKGRPMIDGDSHDLRFLDPQGVYVGLYAKANAYDDTTGFVHDPTLADYLDILKA